MDISDTCSERDRTRTSEALVNEGGRGRSKGVVLAPCNSLVYLLLAVAAADVAGEQQRWKDGLPPLVVPLPVEPEPAGREREERGGKDEEIEVGYGSLSRSKERETDG